MMFFFSSRRRHTRWTGDWSSDVCSSDLCPAGLEPPTPSLEGWCSIRLSYGQSASKAAKTAKTLVGVRGFEPPTSCSQSKRATRLRHTPKMAPNDTLSASLEQCDWLATGGVFCYKSASLFWAAPEMAVELTRKSFTPYAAKKGEEYMNAKQRGHFRKILETLKSELSEEIDRTVHTMQDEATVFADPNDRASQESDMALELRNRDRERKLIKKIDETIARIDA